MSRKTAVIVSILLFIGFQIKSDVGSDIVDFFDNVGADISDSLSSFFTSDTLTVIGETFGVVPEDCVYSYVIWNDSNVPIYSCQQSMTSFMGGTFPNAVGVSNEETINPWSSSSSGITVSNTEYTDSYPATSEWEGTSGTSTVTNQQMLFDLYISDESSDSGSVPENPLYHDQIDSLSEEGSTKVYHYRAYNSREWSGGSIVHVPKIELLGYSQTASDDDDEVTSTVTVSGILSSMVFLNNTADDVQVTFTYGSELLTTLLEAYSFNSISLSDTTMSLRPNSFSFYDSGSTSPFATVPFADVGIDGSTYTMEIYQDTDSTAKSVGLQGLSLGNYDAPISSRVRDVTPITCNLWWESVSQYVDANGLSDESAAAFVDLPGQIWAVYDSEDSPIMSKVTVGEAISWNLIRPTLDKGEDYVYFVYVQTSSDSVAEAFISQFMYGSIGDTVKASYVTGAEQAGVAIVPEMLSALSSSDSSTSTLSSEEEIAIMRGSLDYTIGAMTDDSGTVGYLLGADYFASFGIGGDTQNYVVSPSMYNLSTLVSTFSMYMTAPDDLESDLQQWIVSYVQSPSIVQGLVENLLIQYGASSYVVDGALTDLGNMVVELLLTGPVSIENPSIDMTVVQNQYVYSLSSTAPTGMPSPNAVSSTEIPMYAAVAA